MGVRLIAGRAGSGKTHWCLTRIAEALQQNLIEGPRLILLVPEQAALQMERSLVAMAPARTLGRCDVLSFRRLARRVLTDAAGPRPLPLTPIGRQMALRHLIGRNRRALREFGPVADRSGFIEALASGIAEFFQEGVAPRQLQLAAEKAAEAGDPSSTRLHDIALLYQAYLEYLGDQRVDPEGVLDLARSRLGSAEWLRGAHVWIDGFAGLTRQQLELTATLGGICAHIDIALLLDPRAIRGGSLHGPLDDLSIFARTERTWAAMERCFRERGIPCEPPVILAPEALPRFNDSPALGHLEKHLFHSPLSRESEESRGGASDADAARSPIRLLQAPHIRAEAAACVRAIVDLVKSPTRPMRYRDIAIVVRDLEPYHDILSAELAAHAIPFFIDRRRPVHHHPLARLARAALALRGGGRFDEAITQMLKTGLSGLTDDACDELENYILAHGLSTAKSWEEPWTHPPAGVDAKYRDRPHVKKRLASIVRTRDRLRGLFGEWWPDSSGQRAVAGGESEARVAASIAVPSSAKSAQSAVPSSPPDPNSTCRYWAAELFALLERLAVDRRLAKWCQAAESRGDLDEAEEHQQIWAEWTRLLDELFAALGDEAMTARQFRECVESGLSQLTLGLVPPTLDQVLVSSIERSRHPPVRSVFVLGFADGTFPARIAEDELLGDEERALLERQGVELPRTRARRMLDERMLAYIAFTRPSRFLWVSYPQTSPDGRKVVPSPFWAHLKAAAPQSNVEDVATGGLGTISTVGALTSALAAGALEHAREELDPKEFAAWLGLMHWAGERPDIRRRVETALRAHLPTAPARLSAETVARLWGRAADPSDGQQSHRPVFLTNPGALERFAWCPYQHYALRGLRLAPRAVHEIAAIQYGDLYHRILEQFVNELMESGQALGDMSPGDIAASLSRLCEQIVPRYADEFRMDEGQRERAVWRGQRVLPAAVHGQRETIGQSPLRPKKSEQAFGSDEVGALPALELRLAGGAIVRVRGKLDRLDLLATDRGPLTVVFDYKSGSKNRLELGRVYHGLSLQLLTYLLVLRDHGEALGEGRLIPGGAFYLPLLAGLHSVDHPADADEADFRPFGSFGPRGIVDFDWINQIDPALKESNKSLVLNVALTKEEKLSRVDQSDGVDGAGLPPILEFVRGKLTRLAEDWLSGNIAVAPARIGKTLPCTRCAFRSVCRYEYDSEQTRRLTTMNRTLAMNLMGTGRKDSDG